MKMNENGVTLIELLAALMIGSIIIGALGMLFMSINLEWSSSTNKYNDDVVARNAINQLTAYLTDSTEVCVQTNQFLFKQADGEIKRVRFEEGGTLYLEQMTTLPHQVVVSLCDFVQPLRLNVLANNLAIAPTFSPASSFYGNGDMFTITYTFNYANYDITGKVAPQTKDYQTTIKLFKEPIFEEGDE